MSAPTQLPTATIAAESIETTDCDICLDHLVWACPSCGASHDHWQVDPPLVVNCGCGTANLITVDAYRSWERRFGLS